MQAIATKTMKWCGRDFGPGEPLDPEPAGEIRARLVRSRFVRLVEDPEET